ncbi:MAG: glycosyltransferase [Bacteroidota bacterium]|nr:glycosyltransferase [Bacteroidota bacterium]
MIENQDIIVLGLQPWDLDIAFTLKYTAIEMSKKNRVLFLNPPLHRGDFVKQPDNPRVIDRKAVMNGEKDNLFQYNDNLWVFTPKTVIESINWIPVSCIHDFFNKRNDKRFANEAKKAIEKLNFKNYILFNDNSMLIGFYFKEFLKPRFSIYLLRDAVTLVSYHAKHGKRLEPQLINKMDLMVANSDFFADFGREYNKHSYMIGQGCDLDIYNDADGDMTIPDDLLEIKQKPIIGFVGALTTIRLDIDTLVYIAESKPEWSLVLVGPEDEGFKASKLHSLNNVHFLGRKNPQELPNYIKGFDVALNPQIVNQITDINYPLKIDEYLAMGKPTVATRTTFMKYFEDYTYLPSSKEEYVIAIENALSDNSSDKEKKRIAFAKTHTWENFVNKIYSHIKTIESEKQ